ncbi:MAG: hypothetical protein ACLU3U_04675 [Gallintestinimicrobium sp.]
MSELYGVTSWSFDFRRHKLQGDWQAALGITLRVPHLSWVSMKGEAKRDYPASINYQSPWCKEYKTVEDHFARVNTAMTREGSCACRRHSSNRKLLASLGTGVPDRIDPEQMEERFQNVTRWLLFGSCDFDFLMNRFCLICVRSRKPAARSAQCPMMLLSFPAVKRCAVRQ